VTFDAEGAIASITAGADIVLIGHPYLNGSDSEKMLTDFVGRVREIRPTGETSSARANG
jgi:hypothetical protein